jgi:methionyl-tRNA formyltransferase
MGNKEKTISTIFIGTPDFAVPGLQSLIDDDFFAVDLVITQKDKKIGRKQSLNKPAVKKLAEEHKITILQPSKISNIYDEIKTLKPDLIVVIAYGQIIPQNILDLPKHACINVHASLLPKYRGAACIQAAILNRDKTTGLTIMKMDAELDTGPIIYQKSINIKKDDTAGTLFDKLAEMSQNILPSALKKYIHREITEAKQDDSLSSYVGMMKKEDGKIDWNKSAKVIEAQIRAMSPWPGSYSILDDIKIKIIKAGEIIEINKYENGKLFIDDKALFVQCEIDALEIKQIQVSGKKVVSASDFIHGYAKFIGKQFS